MHLRTIVASIQYAAGAPEGPSRDWRSPGDALGTGFEEVELVERSFVDCTAQED